jgi:hypothetical protein
MPEPTHQFFDLFALDLQRVLNDEISGSFATLVPTPLNSESLGILREYETNNPRARKGLYVLHHNGVPTYVGKADDVLSDRLTEHHAKLSARLNISINDVTFRCLYLDQNWSALAHESPLIESMECVWNNNGFGNHDPGRRRDTTRLKPAHFDRLYPINPDASITTEPGEMTVHGALSQVKFSIPYLFRCETTEGFEPRGSHPDYQASRVVVAAQETAASLLGKIVTALGSQWQLTFLYGYVILYKENTNYTAESAFKVKRGGANWSET